MAHIHEAIDFTVGAFLVHDGRVLLVHHRETGFWLSPGGHVELDEDTDQALWREIAEETGLQSGDIEMIGDPSPTFTGHDAAKSLHAPRWTNIHRINAHHRHIVLIYLFRAKTDRVSLSGEHHAIRWFSSTELDNPTLNTPVDTRWYAREAIRIAA